MYIQKKLQENDEQKTFSQPTLTHHGASPATKFTPIQKDNLAKHVTLRQYEKPYYAHKTPAKNP